MKNTQQTHPSLPRFMQLPFRVLPAQISHQAIRRALNTLFNEPLKQGELDFLAHKTIDVHIQDSGTDFCVSLANGRLDVGPAGSNADLIIRGKLYAFLMLATRKEDADTLFFRRQLQSEGDTELGLFVKNFLDGLEPQTLPAHRILEACMQKALLVADRTPEIIERLPGPIRSIISSTPFGKITT